VIQQPSAQWVEDCDKWRGQLLTGDYAHWCDDWDGLPMDETCPEWPCACADSMTRWRLSIEHWQTPTCGCVGFSGSADGWCELDAIWQTWYTCGMPLHIRFICKTCKRPITGCPPSCTEPTHRTEEVESCAVCKQTKPEKEKE
jgi:hypothetical protein